MPSFDQPLPTEINGPIQAVLGNPSGKPVAQMISSRGDYAPANSRPVAAPIVERAIAPQVIRAVEAPPAVVPVPVAVFHSTPAPVAVPETPETVSPQVTSPVEEVEEVVSSKPPTPKKPKMSEQQPIVNNYYGAPGHHGHTGYEAPVYHLGAQPYAVAPQPLVVQQAAAAGYPVETAKVPGTDLTKGVLRIGADAYDLTGAVLDSLEFKARFIAMLTEILSRDLNVQNALLTPNEKAQDAAIAQLAQATATADMSLAAMDQKLKHALQCAYYEDGDLVFPGLKNECGKDARITIPPVKSMSYDVATNTLKIGSAELPVPVKAIAESVAQSAFDFAAKGGLPQAKKADRITDVFVKSEDSCHPAQVANMEMFSEAILSDGIPSLCEKGKIVEVETPTKLLAFGKACREFGYVSLEKMMLAMSKFLVKAPKGSFPVELRGYGAGDGLMEQRYPVTVEAFTPISNSGAIAGSGDGNTGLVGSSSITLAAPKTGLYVITAQVDGYIFPDIDAVMNKGYVDRFVQILVNGNVIVRNGSESYFDTSNQRHFININTTAITLLPAGTVVGVQLVATGGGKLEFKDVVASVTLMALGTSAININP